jgi:hypothetical protein
VYQLGGWFSFNSQTHPAFTPLKSIPPAAVWEYNPVTEAWRVADGFDTINTGTKVDRPGAAANCDAPSIDTSFIFSGYVQQRSDAAYINYTQSSEFKCE